MNPDEPERLSQYKGTKIFDTIIPVVKTLGLLSQA